VAKLRKMSALIDKTGIKKLVVKLDKNFHIYIHGKRDKITEGVDDKGKFIKLYYDEAN
jgi:hypothetical protein